MEQTTGADIIIHALQRAGVAFVAGMPGGANLPLYDAMQRGGLRHVLVRHEQAAGFVAQGVSRASDQVGVCFATSGPGAANLLTAVADAHRDSMPLLVITGQVPTALIGTDAFQELDIVRMAQPITKAAHRIDDPSALDRAVADALQLARSGRPGPVWLDVPKDVLSAKVTLRERTRELPKPARKGAGARQLREARELLAAAQRPILYVGGGLRGRDAREAVTALAEHLQAPVTTTLMGLGLIDRAHPLALGMLGMHGAPHTNHCLRECDLLLALGVRFDDRATGKLSEFCPDAQVIHVDIDPRELGKLRKPQLAIEGDAQLVAFQLRGHADAGQRSTWVKRVRELKTIHPQPPLAQSSNLDDPAALLAHLSEAMDGSTRITTDVGQHQMWAAQHLDVRFPGQLLTSGGLGTMGFGLPAAIGAALATREPTLCITGDGSLMLSLPELATLAEQQADVKVLVLDNGQLGLVRQQQQLFFGERYAAAHYRQRTDFVAAAEALGLAACRLPPGTARDTALAEALRRPGPLLIHAPVRESENVWPMVPPGAANHEMLLSYSP